MSGRRGADGKLRRLMASGAALTVAGLALAATAPVGGTAPVGRIEGQQTAGGVLLLAGWGLLGWGIHRFGRAGARQEQE